MFLFSPFLHANLSTYFLFLSLLDYDYCKYSADESYESQTAEAKQAFLWSRVVAEAKESGSWPNQAGIFAESVKTSFDDYSDVFPGGRTKCECRDNLKS